MAQFLPSASTRSGRLGEGRIIVFEYFDEYWRYCERDFLQIAKPFYEVNDRVRVTLYSICDTLENASKGKLYYTDLAPEEFFGGSDFFSGNKNFQETLPWLVSANSEPVQMKTIFASTWHEATIALFQEIVRRTLLAGGSFFEDLLLIDSKTRTASRDWPDSFDRDAAIKTLLEYAPIDYHKVNALLEIEVVTAWNNWQRAGSPPLDNVPPPLPLSDTEQKVFDFISSHPGVIGKQVDKELDIPESTLSRHVFPKLRRHGLRNRHGFGYYIKGTENSAEPR